MIKEKNYKGATMLTEPLPHSDELEKGVLMFCLSTAFRHSTVRASAYKRLKHEYFYNTLFGDCFKVLRDMIDGTRGVRVPFPEPETFAQFAYENAVHYPSFRRMRDNENKGFQEIELLAYDIMQSEFLEVNGEYAITQIVDMYKQRQRYTISEQLKKYTRDDFGDEYEKRQSLYDQLAELETVGKEEYDELYTTSTYSATSSALQHQGAGLHTDYIMGKEQRGRTIKREFKIPPKQITVIAAATGHGKTTFCYNLALRLIKHNKRPDGSPLKVVYLSYEEPRCNIEPKIINTIAGVNLAEDNREKIAEDIASNGNGAFIDNDVLRAKYNAAVKEYYDMATAGTLAVKYCNLDASALCGFIRDLRRRDAADVVIIDYVQLIEKESSKAHGRNRPDELKEICADLRGVATDEKLGLPVIVASQFNRDVQKFNDPRKMDKTNLGESANIEHVANVILGLWNCQEISLENYTDSDGNPNANGESLAKFQHTANIDDPFIYARLLKSRDGVNGLNMTLNYYGNCGRIDNTTDETPNERAGYKRDENTEPHNTLTPAISQGEPAPAAEEPAPASGETETRKWKSGKDALPF